MAVTGDSHRADARLIAAAPEMLALLEAFVSYCGQAHSLPLWAMDRAASAAAVIAKAKGMER